MLGKKIKELFNKNLIGIILLACVVCFLALAKDISAGAVLVFAIGSAIIGLLIFVSKLIYIFGL